MLSAEEQIQKTVVSLEMGSLSRLIWRAVVVGVALGLAMFYLVHEFKGLPIGQAMDQAQVGREILRGNGWQTKFIRPLALGELKRHGKDVNTAIKEDTYNAPIPPLLDAVAMAIPYQHHWGFEEGKFVYPADRAIACMGVTFFLASLWVLYVIAEELFDRRLAGMAVGLVLISDAMWQYSVSGLPQMFLLLMLHLNVLAVLRAMRRRYLNQPHLLWLAAAGFGFGIMALTHALSIFIFVPVLAFSVPFFRPKGLGALLMLMVFLAVYTPWLVRNQMVCGDFRGLAGFSGLDGIVRSEAGHMRRFAIDLSDASGNYYASNFRLNLIAQINRIFEYMGWSCVAPIALVSVLHAFRRPNTATFRWLLFAMWGSAVVGMGIFGMKEEGALAANQFYLLFVPLFICYGMAYVLVQWDRRIGLGFILPQWGERSGVHYFLRRAMVITIFLLTALPLIGRIFVDKVRVLVQWPPYLPPYIASMAELFKPDEIIASDMPWAVAWYADRRSVWLPIEPKDLVDMVDYKTLGATVGGIYLTPVSGTQNTLGDLIHGDYSLWTGYIVRTIKQSATPFPYRMLMGPPDCVLYMDSERRRAGAPLPKI